MPSVPTITPPVGRSGPGIKEIRSSLSSLVLLSNAIAPAITSRRLCGAMLVAIPTAIPDEPFTSRFGKAAGRTSGSDNWAS